MFIGSHGMFGREYGCLLHPFPVQRTTISPDAPAAFSSSSVCLSTWPLSFRISLPAGCLGKVITNGESSRGACVFGRNCEGKGWLSCSFPSRMDGLVMKMSNCSAEPGRPRVGALGESRVYSSDQDGVVMEPGGCDWYAICLDETIRWLQAGWNWCEPGVKLKPPRLYNRWENAWGADGAATFASRRCGGIFLPKFATPQECVCLGTKDVGVLVHWAVGSSVMVPGWL